MNDTGHKTLIPDDVKPYPSQSYMLTICRTTGCEHGKVCVQERWCRVHRIRVHNGFMNGQPMHKGWHPGGVRARRPKRTFWQWLWW